MQIKNKLLSLQCGLGNNYKTELPTIKKLRIMGIFMYVSRCQAMFEGFLTSVGKECKTTFYSDLSIAEHYGAKAVVDTYRRVMAEWGDDLEYMCEWVVALNQKIWQHYKQNEPLARVYDELWRKADNYCREHFKGADLVEYYRYID